MHFEGMHTEPGRATKPMATKHSSKDTLAAPSARGPTADYVTGSALAVPFRVLCSRACCATQFPVPDTTVAAANRRSSQKIRCDRGRANAVCGQRVLLFAHKHGYTVPMQAIDAYLEDPLFPMRVHRSARAVVLELCSAQAAAPEVLLHNVLDVR